MKRNNPVIAAQFNTRTLSGFLEKQEKHILDGNKHHAADPNVARLSTDNDGVDPRFKGMLFVDCCLPGTEAEDRPRPEAARRSLRATTL